MGDEKNLRYTPPEILNKIKRRNFFLAGAMNIIAPGLGYFYCGKTLLAFLSAIFIPVLFLSVDFISSALPYKINAIFFISAYALIFIIPAGHVIIFSVKNKKYRLNRFNKGVYYILFLILTFSYAVYLKECSFESHAISSGSMKNTILIKDQVLVRYNYFGFYEPIEGKIKIRFCYPQKNEVVVFNGPYHAKNTLYMKRIACLPGDTLQIIKRKVYVNGIAQPENPLFLYDNNRRKDTDINGQLYPTGAQWNEDNYGPLYIPKKGKTIKIDSSNTFIWKPLIMQELKKVEPYNEREKQAEEFIKNGKYEIKNNYYFMLGDDRSNSMDSRYIGLIAEDDIVGKAEFIIYNPDFPERTGIIIK